MHSITRIILFYCCLNLIQLIFLIETNWSFLFKANLTISIVRGANCIHRPKPYPSAIFLCVFFSFVFAQNLQYSIKTCSWAFYGDEKKITQNEFFFIHVYSIFIYFLIQILYLILFPTDAEQTRRGEIGSRVSHHMELVQCN
jgi:hypothetical protein